MTTHVESQNEAAVPEAAQHSIHETMLCCSNCQNNSPLREYLTHEGDRLCSDCHGELVAVCSECAGAFWRDDMTVVLDRSYCESCTNALFRYCASCQEYRSEDRVYYSEINDADYCEDCFSDYVTHCTSCDGQIDPQDCRINEAGECFCDHCWSERDHSERGEYLEFTSESFLRCASRRKYGIEIETLLESGNSHLPVDRIRSWKQVYDGSLGDLGREYVSPILQGDQGFHEIDEFTAILKESDYFVKRQCGLHVHIDGRDLTCQDIKMLLKIMRYYEPIFYAMLPASRYEGTYSVPLERIPKSRFRTRIRDEDTLKKLWYGQKSDQVDLKSKYHHSRYYGLNIHSWFFRRSLEFRYHSGTLNPLKITNFIVICQAVVDKAKETKKFRMSVPADFHSHFESFVSFFCFSPELALYVRERILKFHPERLADPAVLRHA